MKETKNMEKIIKIINKKNYCDRYFNKKVLALYLKDFRKSKNNGFVIWQYIFKFFVNNFNKFIQVISFFIISNLQLDNIFAILAQLAISKDIFFEFSIKLFILHLLFYWRSNLHQERFTSL